MPLTLTRAATVLSLSQLAVEAEGPAGGSPQPPKGMLSTPDKAVRDVAAGTSLLPLYSFPSADGFLAKRVRSFGSFQDLAAAGAGASTVPDVDDGCAAAGPAWWGGGAVCTLQRLLRRWKSFRPSSRLPLAGPSLLCNGSSTQCDLGAALLCAAVLTARLHRPAPRCSAGSDEEALSLDGTISSGASDAGQVVPQRSVLDALLLGEWEDRAEVGPRWCLPACCWLCDPTTRCLRWSGRPGMLSSIASFRGHAGECSPVHRDRDSRRACALPRCHLGLGCCSTPVWPPPHLPFLQAGLFRYDVTACPTKLVPGAYGFIAQCNEGRLSKKRPTEFRIDQVRQRPARTAVGGPQQLAGCRQPARGCTQTWVPPARAQARPQWGPQRARPPVCRPVLLALCAAAGGAGL